MATPYIGVYATSYPEYVLSGGTAPPPTPDFGVTVDAQRVASMTPGGVVPAQYEYQFRAAPTVDAQRVADMTQTLAAGESPTDYEIQVR